MKMHATTHRAGDSLAHAVDVNGRHTIVTDEPVRLGGTDEGPAPHELLPAALASCIATTMAMYARRHDWDIGDAFVDVEYDPEAVPRSFEVEVHLPDGLSDEQVRRLGRVAESCPLRRALETGFSFDERIVAGPKVPA